MDITRRSFIHRGSSAAVETAVRGSSAVAEMAGLNNRSDRKPSVPASLNNGDLSPYVPRAGKPWDERRAAHLLRRAGYGVTPQELALALQSTPAALVAAMLSQQALPQQPAFMAQPLLPMTNAEMIKHYNWTRDLQEWWFMQMMDSKNMLREKMVLFYHNHFVSDFPVVYTAHYLFIQNQLFRQNAFGSFKDLAKQVTVDPAMLIYLSGNDNKAGKPNENYGRELMELFTLGAGNYKNGTPHYTEHDIIEMARALTGWTVNGLTSQFNPARFDTGDKTIFGTTGNFGVNGKTPMDIIDHIFSQVDPDYNHKRAAAFICEKLYRYFVYDNAVDPAIVAGMAQTLEDNNWNIGPVLQQLLISEHFFDDNVIGAKIKSPTELVAGSMRTYGLTPGFDRNASNSSSPETHDPITAMAYLAQLFFYPPNVKGWPGGRTWISSATTPLRIRYSQYWAEPISTSHDYKFDQVAFVLSLLSAAEKQLAPADQVHKTLDHLLALLLPVVISDTQKSILLDTLLGGGFDYDWDATKSLAKIKACLVRITQLGEYQLM